jgi:hypothetical protein
MRRITALFVALIFSTVALAQSGGTGGSVGARGGDSIRRGVGAPVAAPTTTERLYLDTSAGGITHFVDPGTNTWIAAAASPVPPIKVWSAGLGWSAGQIARDPFVETNCRAVIAILSTDPAASVRPSETPLAANVWRCDDESRLGQIVMDARRTDGAGGVHNFAALKTLSRAKYVRLMETVAPLTAGLITTGTNVLSLAPSAVVPVPGSVVETAGVPVGTTITSVSGTPGGFSGFVTTGVSQIFLNFADTAPAAYPSNLTGFGLSPGTTATLIANSGGTTALNARTTAGSPTVLWAIGAAPVPVPVVGQHAPESIALASPSIRVAGYQPQGTYPVTTLTGTSRANFDPGLSNSGLNAVLTAGRTISATGLAATTLVAKQSDDTPFSVSFATTVGKAQFNLYPGHVAADATLGRRFAGTGIPANATVSTYQPEIIGVLYFTLSGQSRISLLTGDTTTFGTVVSPNGRVISGATGVPAGTRILSSRNRETSVSGFAVSGATVIAFGTAADPTATVALSGRTVSLPAGVSSATVSGYSAPIAFPASSFRQANMGLPIGNVTPFSRYRRLGAFGTNLADSRYLDVELNATGQVTLTTIIAATPVITPTSMASVYVGQRVSGLGIPIGAYIISTTATTATMNVNATLTGPSVSVTFGRVWQLSSPIAEIGGLTSTAVTLGSVANLDSPASSVGSGTVTWGATWGTDTAMTATGSTSGNIGAFISAIFNATITGSASNGVYGQYWSTGVAPTTNTIPNTATLGAMMTANEGYVTTSTVNSLRLGPIVNINTTATATTPSGYLAYSYGQNVLMSANATTSGSVSFRAFPWGAGDGTTTFGMNVDVAGRGAQIAGQAGSVPANGFNDFQRIGTVGGRDRHLQQANEAGLPSHRHTFFLNSATSNLSASGGERFYYESAGTSNNALVIGNNSELAGGNQAVNPLSMRQPTAVLGANWSVYAGAAP